MGCFAFVNINNGYVEKVAHYGDGNVPPAEDGFLIVEIDKECVPEAGLRLAYRDGEFVLVPITLSTDEAWTELRRKRDDLLKSTDWTQGADVPETIKTAYAAYRQVLRDLPANTVDPLNPVWPEEPTV